MQDIWVGGGNVGICGGSMHEGGGKRENIMILDNSGNGENWMRRLQERRDREGGEGKYRETDGGRTERNE